MSRGVPPPFEPPPFVEPLTAEKFMTLLDDYIFAVIDVENSSKKERDELKAAVKELFRRLAT